MHKEERDSPGNCPAMFHSASVLHSWSADAVDDGLVGRQRGATPVRRDVAEESVLDLVPLARAGFLEWFPGVERHQLLAVLDHEREALMESARS